MINYSKKSDFSNIINLEKKVVNYCNEFELNIKYSLETYIEEFGNVTFENEILKTMLLNNFANAVIQVENNIQNIQSLSNILEILEKQDEITSTDTDTYNKLASKVTKDIELLQNFLFQTISSFDNVPFSGKKKSINVLNTCKENLLQKFNISGFAEDDEPKLSEKPSKSSSKKSSKTVKKKMDLDSSDLLCFFPKNKSDSLVISTVQDNYKISFKGEIANIYIEDEDFNLSLKTSGVQVSNSNSSNILLVSQADNKYTIITNGQIEIPPFIQVSKIAKNDDFLEVEISNKTLSLDIEDNVINFEDESQEVEEEEKIITTSLHKESENTDTFEVEKSKKIKTEPVSPKNIEESPDNTDIIIQTDDEIKDNDTLIISDSNQNVILPYKVVDLEKKLKENKKYKSLQDVIKNEYTLPLETFKNPTKSRFREAFQLIKKKEHGSLKEAIELGFELMFQSDLNPAVIAACKDLDELDIYLDCLDDNELDKFSCFKIEYNVPPTSKSKKK